MHTRCLHVVVGMPRLGIGPSSLTGHQAAAKVYKKLRCTLPSIQVHSKHKARTYAHTHDKLTPSKDYYSRRAVTTDEDGHEPRLGIGPSSKATRPW